MVETSADVRVVVRRVRAAGGTIGLVPTMGALHDGHMALARSARRECELVVVSIFVNPAQFSPGEDFARYPRDLKADAARLLDAGADVLFAPTADAMYPPGYQTWVEVSRLSRMMCGRSRPGHFRGMATVVTKLFNIVQPDRAYFGEKDGQQLRIARRLARDLDFPVNIVAVPTVREESGLAMSSRNQYLSAAERAAAAALSRALFSARDLIAAGERDAAAVRRAALAVIAAEPLLQLEYLVVARSEDLKPQRSLAGEVCIALAARAGDTRLIDNVTVNVG
jgi:pantoate--beta-alanine ligase